MEEKTPLITPEASAEPTIQELSQRVAATRADYLESQREYHRAWSKTRAGKVAQWFAFSLMAFVLFFFVSIITLGIMEPDDDEYLPRRVPLEAHIMSKCPDSRDCLHDLVLPAMQNVSHLVDFKLSYIGSTNQNASEVTCKHGPGECLGNTLELCAAHLYPNPKIYLGFTMCMTKSFSQIPEHELVEDCALEHGIDFAALNRCVSADDGQVGYDLLRNSVQRSQDAGVKTSCTIRLDGKTRCVRDDGKWTDCEGGHEPRDLVEDVLEARMRHSQAYLKAHPEGEWA